VADLLVTGTDTGVGKSVIAAALILVLRERNIPAVGFKPAETGLDPKTPSDSRLLAKASGFETPLVQPLLAASEALAPAVAADRSGRRFDPPVVAQRIRALRSTGRRVIVEGAGGLLVPLAWGYTAADMALECGLETVIVARAGLGTLNHVMLTYDALIARGLPVRGVVLNGRHRMPDIAEETNPEALARMMPHVPIVVNPRHASDDPLEAAYASVPFIAGLA
jgi:dethiobiotin synthetase